MIAMVLAAGLGTRLRPLTHRIPKPALPLLGSSLLACNLELLASAGVREVVVNAHHLPEQVAAEARRAAGELDLRLHLSFERGEALGTGGALLAARPLLDRGAPFLLLNGDLLCDFDLREAVEVHRRRGADATMVLLPRTSEDYAPVEVDEAGWIARVAGLGRPLAPGERLRPFLFTGIHVLEPFVFEALPEGISCINRQGHAQWIAAGRKVHAHVASGRWSDVGTPARYAEANLDLLAGRYRLPLAQPGEGVLLHPDARVEPGATLTAPAYIGAGAHVAAGARVGPNAVVLREARVEGSVRDAVVAPGARVAAGEGARVGLWVEGLRPPADR